jgi:hypothetical protein
MKEVIKKLNASKIDDFPDPFEPINKTSFASSGIFSIVRSVNRLKFFNCSFVIRMNSNRIVSVKRITSKVAIYSLSGINSFNIKGSANTLEMTGFIS